MEEDSAAGDTGEQNLLLEFLDLPTNEEKIMFLQRIRAELTGSFLSAAAQSMDFYEKEEELELRYLDLLRYLETLARYEKRF